MQSGSRVFRSSRRRTSLLVGAAALAVVAATGQGVATAGPSTTAGATVTVGGRTFTVTPLTGTVVHGAKSSSGRLAKSDAALLRTTTSSPVHVVVKLDYDSLAAYRGGVAGLAATSPAATKRPLDPRSSAYKRYERYAAGVESRFVGALRQRVPAARVGRSLRTVYGGVALTLPGNRAKSLLSLPGVAAVQRDSLQKPLTDASPDFIGAPTVYAALHDTATAGRGVLVGVLDTGAWPEHPSYADPGTLPAPPPTRDGRARVCDFGDNPTTPAVDVFACTNKLVSGEPFLDTYNAVVGGETFGDSARDSEGHGTHTSTTSAGGPVSSVPLLGVDRGPIHGIAPGASIAMYKVCGQQGCFTSDSAAAVARAILDGVRVINFSISGGVDPFSDPVEMAFLDAYAAGVLVSASAGNEGPGAATVNHNSPWVTTVAASTQRRAFESTVTLTGGGATSALTGASVTAGVATPAPVVLASAAPYADERCTTPAAAGTFTGKIVACARGGNARVDKGFNVLQGGAVGMLLYNKVLSDTETDNHWLPAVHLEQPAGAALLAFLAAHPDTTATFTAGQKVQGQGDVIAGFSSRGPGRDWLKPDVTAPGVQILAGHTPVPDTITGGPSGQLYQAIAGTSMSAPHVAGAAALLFALHPDWTPGQVKSALESTATRAVLKSDRATPADPFDMGGGRIDLTHAGDPGLTFDETAANFAASEADPLSRIDNNLPSVNAPTMPGSITTTRTARNVSGQRLRYDVRTTAPAGTRITVSPSRFEVPAGGSATLKITISAPAAAPGQYFGQIDLVDRRGVRNLHLPVAFNKQQGIVTLDQTCSPATIARRTQLSTCDVTVQNNALQPAAVASRTHLDEGLSVAGVAGAEQVGRRDVAAAATLAAREPDRPTIAPGPSVAGYLPLDAFGVTPTGVGDEDAVNVDVPAFVFAGKTYTALGVTSNGYSVVGGAGPDDVSFAPQTLPDPSPPNGVLASFWTDLDGSAAPGLFIGLLRDTATGDRWIVVESRLNIFGTTSQRVFEQWIGVNGVEDISYAYDPANLPAAPPAGNGLTVGVENDEGNAGGQIAGLPTTDLRVTSTPGTPGGALHYSVQVRGEARGTHDVTTSFSTPLVRGTTTEVDPITVTR